jgi:tetratricopeptide (TPR) repeat protein
MATAVAATCCWMIIAVGSWELYKPGATLDSTLGKLRTARTFLHPWEQPYVLTGSVQSRLFTVGQRDAGPVARSAFAQAAAREPDDAIPLVNLAKLDRELGSLTQAHRELERALAINPQSASVRNGMAALAATEGDVAAARRLYGESLQIQPGDNPAKAALAQLPA